MTSYLGAAAQSFARLVCVRRCMEPAAAPLLRGRSEPFVEEPLDALSFPCLADVDVPIAIGCDTVRGRELPAKVPARSERPERLQGAAIEDPDLLVRAINDVGETLFRVCRERDAVRSPAASLRGDHALLHECSVGLKYLDTIVRAVAHVDQLVVAQRDTVNVAELRAVHIGSIHSCGRQIVRRLAVRAPVAQLVPGNSVEHDDAPVVQAIGNEYFVGGRVDRNAGCPVQVLGIVAALARTRLSDL